MGAVCVAVWFEGVEEGAAYPSSHLHSPHRPPPYFGYATRKRHMVTSLVSAQADSTLQGIPTSFDIGHGLHLDYSLTGNPVITPDSATIPFLGRFWGDGHQHDAGIPQAGPLGEVVGNGQMLCILGDPNAVIGSFAYAASALNPKGGTISASLLQHFGVSDTILDCNCTGQCIGNFLPQIQSKCSGTVSLTLKELALPTLGVNSSGIFFQTHGGLDVKALNVGESDQELFSASISASGVIPAPVSLHDWKITGQVHVTGATLSVRSSNVGTIDAAGLEQLWQLALLAIVDGELNDLAQSGISLPEIPYVAVTNPNIAFNDNALRVCGDIQYTGKN